VRMRGTVLESEAQAHREPRDQGHKQSALICRGPVMPRSLRLFADMGTISGVPPQPKLSISLAVRPRRGHPSHETAL